MIVKEMGRLEENSERLFYRRGYPAKSFILQQGGYACSAGKKLNIFKRTCSKSPGIVYWEEKMQEAGEDRDGWKN